MKRMSGLALVAFVLALFPAVVFRGDVFYERDVHLVWYSQVESFVRAVRGGAWPLWDPYVSFGHPMLANANTQVLYPPTWLNLIAAPETVYVLLVLGHLVIAALGTTRFARAIGLSPGAALLAGGVFVASGPLLSLGNVWHHLASAAWAPWVFLAAERALAAPSARAAALWGMAQGTQVLAGSPDVSLYTGLAIGAYAITPRTGSSLRRRVVPSSIALVVALGLSAGQWIPSLQAAGASARWNLAPDVRTTGALDPLGGALKALSPAILWELPLRPEVGARFTDAGLPFLRSLYLGLPALGMALAGLGARGARARGYLAALTASAVLFSCGSNTPFYPAALALVAPLRALRYPSKAMVLAAFGFALLAGIGFDRWRRDEAQGRTWRLAVGTGLALLAAIEGVLALATLGAWPMLTRFLVAEDALGVTWAQALAVPAARLAIGAGLGGAMAGLVLWAAAHRAYVSWAPPALAALALADLWAANHHINRTVPREFYRLRPPLVDAVERTDEARLLVYSYDPLKPKFPAASPYALARYPSGLGFEAGLALGARLYLLPPLAGAWGFLGSYDPDLLGLYPEPLAELVLAVRESEGTAAYRRYLELGAVRHVVALHEADFLGLEPGRTLPSILALPLRLYRVPDPLPRTYAVGGARMADGAAARAALLDPSFDPHREVVLPDEAAEAPPDFRGSSRIVEARADRVRLDADLSAPGYVVLVDTFDPGWRVTVDGGAGRLLRANGAFRAVAVPRGRHEVELLYRPRGALAGLGLSALTLVLGLALAIPPTGRRDGPV